MAELSYTPAILVLVVAFGMVLVKTLSKTDKNRIEIRKPYQNPRKITFK